MLGFNLISSRGRAEMSIAQPTRVLCVQQFIECAISSNRFVKRVPVSITAGIGRVIDTFGGQYDPPHEYSGMSGMVRLGYDVQSFQMSVEISRRALPVLIGLDHRAVFDLANIGIKSNLAHEYLRFRPCRWNLGIGC